MSDEARIAQAQAERHYVAVPLYPDDGTETPRDFTHCVPLHRWPNGCPVCAAAASGDLSGMRRLWEVTHEAWEMACIVDSESEARKALRDYAPEDDPDAITSITPIWMVVAERDMLPEWEG